MARDDLSLMKNPADVPLFEPIDGRRLSVTAYARIRERIIDGRIAPSTRIAEAPLATQLGVSRTPLREALVLLSNEGLVQPVERKGWKVAPLTSAGAAELFSLLESLERLALETTGYAAVGLADTLEGVLRRSSQATVGPTEILRLQQEWHHVLLRSCPNRTLADIVASFMGRVLRYEMACVREGAIQLESELESVTQCLSRRNFAGAARFIEMHWHERGNDVVKRLAFPEGSRTA